MFTKKLNFLLITFAISGVAIFAMVAAGGRPEGQSTAATAATTAAAPARADDRELPAPPPPSRRGGDSGLYLPNIADIAERANPAVVNIRATEIIRPGSKKRRPTNDPFEFFFPRPDGRSPHGGDNGDEGDDQRQDSGGSGFIISEDGYVITNNHVIENADKIVVQLNGDNHEYEGKVVGTDPQTDLALLKIEARTKLPTIPLGDSDHLRVGEWVIAIGNPLAYDHTVTVGVVSAKGRKLVGLSRDVSLDNYIQTDAAINMGNSGGPLLNLKGEAVGINSAISIGGQGISFAIPISMARDVMAQLRDKGKVSRGFLGVTIQDIQQEMKPEEREYWSLDGRRGAFIHSVTPGLPADRAGLKPGDAVVSVDGAQLSGSDDLIRTISAKPPGSKVAIGIIRDGKEKKITAELVDRPDAVARASRPEADQPPDRPGTDRRSGITVEEITPDVRREYHVPSDSSGVIVTHVSQVSSAWEKGLREGDVIVQVNRHPVSSISEYLAIVDTIKPRDLMTLYVVTPGVTAGRFITVRVGDE